MAEALPKNFIDYEEYPQTADIQNRCVSMIARLFNAPTQHDDDNAMGTSTVGSSEAIVSSALSVGHLLAAAKCYADAWYPRHEEALAEQA